MNEFPPKDDGKTAGIVSYFTIVGWLIAYFAMYKDNKTELASYQLRQTLLYHIASIIIYYAAAAIFAGVEASNACRTRKGGSGAFSSSFARSSLTLMAPPAEHCSPALLRTERVQQ